MNWLTDLRRSAFFTPAVVFALLAVVVYFPVFTGKVPFPTNILLYFPAWGGPALSEIGQPTAEIGDLVTSFYPFRTLLAEAIREGTIPLWNPYLLGGSPFLANAQSALFYPPNFLYYILPVHVAWTICLLLRTFLAGLFTSMLVQSIGGSRSGAVLAGIVFSCCGFITAWQGQAMGDAAIWLPLILYSVIRLRHAPSHRAIALTAFAFAMPVLAGHPETAVHVTLAGIALALMLFELRFIGRFTVAGLLAAGLASIQMIPIFEWLPHLPSRLSDSWQNHPLHEGLGFVSRDILRNPNSAGILVPEAAAYVGMVSLLAATVAAFHKNRRYVVFFVAATLVSMAVAYSVDPMPWLVANTPFRVLKNWRLILLANLAIAALAGLGLSALEKDHAAFIGRKRLFAASLLAIALVGAFVVVYKLQLATGIRVEFTRRPSFSRALLFIGAIPLLWRALGGLRWRFFPAAICALAAFDLVTFAHGYMPFAPAAEMYPRSAVFDFLREKGDAGQFRISALRIPYPANSPMVYSIASADGYDICLERTRTFAWDLSEERMDATNFTAQGVFGKEDRRIDMLNVKYFVLAAPDPEYAMLQERPSRYAEVFNDGAIAVFENKTVLPRALVVPAAGIEVIADDAAQMTRIKDPAFDPEKSVVLSEMPPGLSTAAESFVSNVEMIDGGINESTFRVNTSQAGVLVVSQTYYPGWKAIIDGQESDVVAANYALTGIPIPEGTHEIRLVFDPLSFKLGAALTLVSTLIIAVLVLRLRSQGQGAQRDAMPDQKRDEVPVR